MKRWVAVGCAVVVVIAAIVSVVGWESGRRAGWWGETDLMRILKSDPLAAEDVLGLRRVAVDQTPASGFLGKSQPQYLRSWYEGDGLTPRQVSDELAAYAEQNGWTYDPSTSTEDYWNARKSDPEGNIIAVSLRIVAESRVAAGVELLGTVEVNLLYI